MLIDPERTSTRRPGDGRYDSSSRSVATELYTLGGVRLLQQGSDLDVSLGSKHLALFIYLFHERRPMSPAEVIDLFGQGQEHAREVEGLKRMVKWLRQNVPFANLRLTSDTIEGTGGVWLDTQDVEGALSAGNPGPVAKLYVGEFLEGFESGVPAFDEWANKERGRLKRAWEHALTRLAREAEAAEKWRTATEWWRIVVSRAPMRSEPVAALLAAYAHTGRRDEALETYSDYVTRLERSGVTEMPAVVRQVVSRYPLLQRVAAVAARRARAAKPTETSLGREAPRAEKQMQAWDVEPTPAPPDAFDLSFDLPDVEIPSAMDAAEPEAPDGESRLEAELTTQETPHSFHVLDALDRVAVGFGKTVEGVERAAPELEVESVAMSFQKIAASATDAPPPEEGKNGDSATAVAKADVEEPPAESDDSEPPETQPAPDAREPDRGVPTDRKEEELSRESTVPDRTGSRDAMPRQQPAHSEPQGQRPTRPPRRPTDGRRQNRDLYRATEAILSAFIEDKGGARHSADLPIQGTPSEGRPDASSAVLMEEPSAADPGLDFETVSHEVEPWAEFADTPLGVAVHDDAGDSHTSHTDGGDAWTADESVGVAEIPDLDLDELDLYGNHVTRVRHEVTSVRRAWGPALQIVWGELLGWVTAVVSRVWSRVRDHSPSRRRSIGLEELFESADYGEPWVEPSLESHEAAYAASEAAPHTVPDAALYAASKDEPSPRDAPRHPSDGWQPEGSRQEAAGPSDGETPEPWLGLRDSWRIEESDDEPYVDARDEYEGELGTAPSQPAHAGTFSSLLGRHWYAPVGAMIVVAALAFGPKLIALIGGQGGEATDSGGLSLPTVPLPKVTVRAPAFVETSVSRIGKLFSRTILDGSGEWVIVADFKTLSEPVGDTAVGEEGALPAERDPSGAGGAPDAAVGAELTAASLTLALEADLMQARFFHVFPRGRALVALASDRDARRQTLSLEDALSVAAKEGVSVVIAGTLRRGSAGETLKLQVISPAGDSLYRVSAEVSKVAGRIGTLADLTRAVRRRLGEPARDIDASLAPTVFLSSSSEALNLYSEAVDHFRAGRYREAGLAATAATRQDSTFAVAYHLLAQSLVELGARRQARAALTEALEASAHSTERERLRILGDWLTWTGHLSEAVLTYDELFQRHRDDVNALRSQAVVQRMIGALGGGLGNLRVAYTIDPYDWPELESIARYLGYSGPLPDADSLAAAVRSAAPAQPAE